MSNRSCRVWLLCILIATVPCATISAAHGTAPGSSCPSLWRVVFGTSLDDRITSVVGDDAGNLYVAGYRGGLLGVENYWPVGNSIAFVRKFDASGALSWERTFDTAGMDSIETIAPTPGGRVVVAGRTEDAFPGWVSGGQLDLFAAELTSEGDLLAFGQFGNERPQHPVSIAVESEDSFVVAGYDDIYVLGNAVVAWQDGFVARFVVSAGGGLSNAWWVQDNSIYADEVTGVAPAADKSGEFFVTRNRSGPPQEAGLFVDRMSEQGTLVWRSWISSISQDFIAGAVVSHSGRLYVAGTTLVSLYGPSLGSSDGFLAELDPATGGNVWGRQIGSSQADWISDIAIDADENLVLSGSSAGTIQPGHLNSGDDPFALVLTPQGQARGAWQGLPGPANDGTYVAQATRCTDVVAFAGSLSGISPPANLGRTDAELTLVPIEPFDRIMTSGFEHDQ